ncbi:MAG: dehydrogenase, short-chain alcohol dehydrogenase like [Phenylobacterium sp.]|nr:dehydrogenase, short-chain alcohol dehydrogenase like [Phenylobacterium sp.]
MDEALLRQFSLQGRHAVVVGAASGIGRQAAITFAAAGARLTLADRDEAGLAATAQAISNPSGEVTLVPLDVRDRDAVLALGDRAAAGGAVDVWANVAGVISASSIVETAPEELDRIVDVNLKGVFWGCAAAARIMTAQGHGSIINISSAGADSPSPGLSVYAMTKAAVNMLTRTLAHEVGSAGVRANAVAPGYIDTPMVAYRYRDAEGRIDTARRDKVFAARAQATVLKRIGQPLDVALAMLYLASDASSFMTGQVLRPNGGMVMP